jgi:Zn-dependent protease with chaperone function
VQIWACGRDRFAPKHDPVATAVFAALIALLPAAFVIWWGRGLARLVDDPMLPERLIAARTRNGAVVGFSVALLCVLMWRHAMWALPLLIVARMAASYPLRKKLHGESWSLAGYLSFFSRLILAVFGFWLLLGWTPWLVSLAGSRDWMVAGGLAIVLCLWSTFNTRVFRAILHARPVDDAAIRSRFDEMVKACAVPAVALEQVDLRGGSFSNAVALPSLRGNAVVVSSTLLERLEHEETIAILGHELAHIEHYHPARLRRMSAVTFTLIVIAVVLTPLLRTISPPALTAGIVMWNVFLVAVMVAMSRHRQKHETASDLRAIALAGNPDALIRALTKVHAFLKLPRRWDVEWERHATHPSLARRIQAIQAAAGQAPASLGEPATFAGSDGAASVIFHHDRVQWNEGPTTSHTIDYARLTMLRIVTKSSDKPRLVALDLARRRWEMVLQPGDIARAQATLDIVDTRLAALAPPPAVSLALPRILALLAMLAIVTVDQFSAVFVAALAAMLPAGPLTAAAGAASIAAAAQVLRDHSLGGIDWRPWMALASLTIGAALIAVSIVNRRERTPAVAGRLIGVIAVAALASWLLVVLMGVSAIDLHRGMRAWPSAAVFALALGGALAFTERRTFRYASGPLLAVGLLAIFMGSIRFLDRFGNDPFLGSADAVAVRSIDAAEANDEFEVPFEVTEMSLSPGGRFASFQSEDSNEDVTIHAGPINGPFASFAADQAVFVDEARVLLVDSRRGTSTLRVVDLEQAGREVWSRQVPFYAEHVMVDRASRCWQLLGWNDNRDIVSVTGTVGRDEVNEESWKRRTDDGGYMRPLAVANNRMLALESKMSSAWRSSLLLIRLATLMRQEYGAESRFWSIGRDGASPFATSHFDLRCPHQNAGQRLVCAAYDGTRTGIYSVDAATQRLTAMAVMTGRFFPRGATGAGWMTGWWEHAPVLMHPATRTVLRVDGRDQQRPDLLAMTESIVGAVWSNGSESTVRLYSIN